jgi:hypothetical protein
VRGGYCTSVTLNPGVFYKYFYNHARRPRLETWKTDGHFKPLPDPGRYLTVSEIKYNGYIMMQCQWQLFKTNPFTTKFPGSGTEIIPVEDPHTRIKPLASASAQRTRPLHNRYTRAGVFVRWVMAVIHSRYKFVTVSLLKRLRGVGFRSETATWIQKWFKISAGASRKPHM